MKKIFALIGIIILSKDLCFAQSSIIEELNKEHLNWYNKDLKTDLQAGVSVNKELC